MDFTIRIAAEEDVPVLEELIPLSVLGLQAAYYSDAQMNAAIGPVFGVDRTLIHDGTYYVACVGEKVVGCGGWSLRKTMYGGDRGRVGDDAKLDPRCDAARIRAFFVHPDWARRGIGRAILQACETALCAAGFRRAELVGTLAGEPLYRAGGYEVVERYEVPMTEELNLPVVRMRRVFE